MMINMNYISILRNSHGLYISYSGILSRILKVQNTRPALQVVVPYSTGSHEASGEEQIVRRKQKVSKAMKAYVERARRYDEFMKREKLEYAIGKRHLANMMGEDPETFTQQDVDRAIEYLFPSGLFEPKARPVMKPPEEIHPPKKAAEFDESGRPFHFLFYTGKPNFYQLLHNIVTQINLINDFEDKMIQKQVKPDPNQTIDLSGSEWLSKEQLETMLVETLHESEYNSLVKTLERLTEHPFSYRAKDLITQYRKLLLSQTSAEDIPKPLYDADGRAFVTVKYCLRKSARADVTVRSPGTGKVTINGQGVDYFEDIQPREQVLFPLIFTGLVNSVDVEAMVHSGGTSGQAGAIRWGISSALCSFVDQPMLERMRLAGLLTRDYRKKERKKPGQPKARKKFTWKKR